MRNTFVLLFVLGGCSLGGAPDRALIFCESDADCPDDMRCPARGRCEDRDLEVDDEGPSVLSATFTPSAINDGVVTLELNLDEEARGDIALAFDREVSLAFVRDPASPNVAPRMTMAVDALDAAAYPLRRVTLEDERGNRAVRDVGFASVFVIDTSAPGLRELIIDDGVDDGAIVLSDVAGTDEATVRFSAGEPLASVTVSLANAEATDCEIAPGQVSCALKLTSGSVVDGLNALFVRGVDRAGNEGTLEGFVEVDAAAPGVVEGSLGSSILLGGTQASALEDLAEGDRLELSFVTDDDLGATPSLRFLGAVERAFTIDSVDGRVVRASLAIDDGVTPGMYRALLDLEDDVGHVAQAVEIFSVEVIESRFARCSLLDAEGPGCADLDGDGVDGLRAGCLEGADCDDTNPLVHPGMLEIPGDGVRNDCDASLADLPIDETVGVFVDNETPGGGDGSRAAPMNGILSGRTRATELGLGYLFVAGDRTFGLSSGTGLTHNIVGSLDATTWTRGGPPTVVSPTGPLVFVDAPDRRLYAEGLEVDNPCVVNDVDLSTAILHKVACTVFTYEVPSVVVSPERLGGEVQSNFFVAGASGSRVIGGRQQSIQITDGILLVLNTIGQSVIANDNSGVTVVNSVFTATARCSVCGHLSFFHSRLEHNDGDILTVNGAAAQIIVRDSAVRNSGTGSMMRVATTNASASFTGSLFDTGGVLFLDIAEEVDFGGMSTTPRVDAFEGNNLGNLGPATGDIVHIIPGTLGHNYGGANAAGRPTQVIADIDGDCRFVDGRSDVGPDEHFAAP